MRRASSVSLAACLTLLTLMAVPGCGRPGAGSKDRPAAGEVRPTAPSDRRAKAGKDDGNEAAEEAVPVEVATVSRGPIEAVIRLSSNLEAERDVTVYAQAPRLVERLLVEEGDGVRKGQLLVKLQDDEQELALEKARIQLEQAQRELERQESLFKQGLSSEQVYNDARHAYDQARVAVEEAQRSLAYTEVRAPISGVVTERMVNLGDSVTVNQPLFRIIDFDSIVARVYVPEKDLRRLRVGQPARVFAPALGETPLAGNVLRISPVVDPKTGTVKVTVAVPNQPGLRPGLFVDVELVTDVHPDALLIPKKALVYDNDQVFAFTVGDDHRAHRVEVHALLENPEWVEPADGFSEGDRVVVAGQTGLKEGTLVRLPGEKGGEKKPAGPARRRHGGPLGRHR